MPEMHTESASMTLLQSLTALLIEKGVLTTGEVKELIDHHIWICRDDADQSVPKVLAEFRDSLLDAFADA